VSSNVPAGRSPTSSSLPQSALLPPPFPPNRSKVSINVSTVVIRALFLFLSAFYSLFIPIFFNDFLLAHFSYLNWIKGYFRITRLCSSPVSPQSIIWCLRSICSCPFGRFNAFTIHTLAGGVRSCTRIWSSDKEQGK
jgi:hypothetical protein